MPEINTLTKAQIDKLGDRLRKGNITETDLMALDVYRRSFGSAYEVVVNAIRDRLELEPTGRPAKSTTALVEKLRRETIRLTQIQDIAGCRLVTSDPAEQNRVVESLKALFPNCSVVDRRSDPSYGYRAVHVIVPYEGKLVEVQVRTDLQHQWAELSEKYSDVVDASIKYGGGDESIREWLSELSTFVSEAELNELLVLQLIEGSEKEVKQQVADLQKKAIAVKLRIADMLRDNIKWLEARRNQ